jgi:hypothetical protein
MDEEASSSHLKWDSKYHVEFEPSLRCTFPRCHNLGACGGWVLVAGGCLWRVGACGGWVLVAGGCLWRVGACGGWVLVAGGCSWRVAWQGDNDCLPCSGLAQRPHATHLSLEKLIAGETLKRDA